MSDRTRQTGDLVISLYVETSDIYSKGNFRPDTDATLDFGSPTKRWANIYSADLQLSNFKI